MEIDYQLVGDGVRVTDDYLTLIMDGTFHSVLTDGGPEENEDAHEYMSPLPFHRDERGPAQVIISDYTMNSLINSSIDLGWYDLVKSMTGDDVDQYISGFANAYGSRTEVEITFKPIAGTQKLTIKGGKKGVTKLTGLVEMHI